MPSAYATRSYLDNSRHAKDGFRHGDRDLNRLSIGLLAMTFDIVQFRAYGAVHRRAGTPTTKAGEGSDNRYHP